MQEGKRQKQVGGLLLEELNPIFHKLGLHTVDGGMVSISHVNLTPDLLEARVYLSFFQVGDQDSALKTIVNHGHEIKRELTAKMKHQLRRMPELKFFRDDTLDQMFRMEELFRKIDEDRKKQERS